MHIYTTFRTATIVFLIALLAQSTAYAGSSSSSSSRSSSGSSSFSSSSRSSSFSSDSTSRPSMTSRPSSPAISRNVAGGLRTSPAGRQSQSLLQNSAPASPRLTQIIRERENSSGPGWLGTAFLVSLLSQHDLSSSDRGWIENRIAELKQDGEPAALLPAVRPAITFNYVGLKPSYKVGDHIEITANANDATKKPAPVECNLQGALVKNETGRANVEWKPVTTSVKIMICRAGGHQDRRLIRIL